MAARRGIRSITGLASGGGSVNVPTPNPPTGTPPPVDPPATQQTVAPSVVVATQTIFNATVTRSSGTNTAVVPLVTNAPTALTPTVLALPLSEPFTGADGSVPGPIWTTLDKSTGATLDINSNQLRMIGGTLGSYLDYQYLPGVQTLTNFEATFDVILAATMTQHYFHFGFRGSGTQDSTAGFKALQTSGYFFEIGPNDNYVSIIYRTGAVSADVQTAGVVFAASDTIHVRLSVVGTALKARVWRNSATEPLSWNIDTSHSALSSGKFWIGHTGGTDTTADTIRVDNLIINYAEGSSGGGGSYLDPPTAAAIAGMNATPDIEWDWTGATPFAGWYIYDGSGLANNERSQPRLQNATIVTGEASTTGSAYLRLIVRRETYFGLPLTGVQMEAAGARYGNGAPFYAEVRLRWTGYLGFWGGPWLLAYPGLEYEIDLMETVNNQPPWLTLHKPEYPTTAYAASNDGGWHRYGLRVDTTGFKMFFDNALVLSVTNSTIGTSFVNASMFPKIQHLCGGNFPNGDNGSPIADGSLPFTDKYFDVDYYRIYN